jgi:hypothetical protein
VTPELNLREGMALGQGDAMKKESHRQNAQHRLDEVVKGSRWWNPEYRFTVKVQQFNGIAVKFSVINNRCSRSGPFSLPVDTFLKKYHLCRTSLKVA